jgi:chromosome segregation ATPase
MNLYNLFEKDDKAKSIKGASNKEKDDHQDIKIRDPLLKRKIQKASASTGYAETDLEAIVTQWSREQDRDQEQIDDLKDREDKLEKNVIRLKQREDDLEKDLETETAKRKSKIAQLHAMFDSDIADIEEKTENLIQKEKEYAGKMGDIQNIDAHVKSAFDAVSNTTAQYSAEVTKLKELEREYEDKIKKLYHTQDVLTQNMESMQDEWDESKADIDNLKDDLSHSLINIDQNTHTNSHNHKKQMAQRELEDNLVAFQNPKDEQPMV